MIIDVIIPALDEEDALPKVLREIPSWVRQVVVADNGSRDRTAEVARGLGAVVVHEARRGYGAACLKAMAHLRKDPPDVVVFLDGDASDDPSDMGALVRPIERDQADFVVGSRVRGDLAAGALTPAQKVGNAVACAGLRLLYGARYTDLGPFRAIRWAALEALDMVDLNWGWTVEMQIKVAQKGFRSVEIPVRYRRRAAGKSKVSGTIKGSVQAGTKILWLLAKHRAAM